MTDYNVKGYLSEKAGTYYAVLSWYENQKRKMKWVSTKLPVVRGNKNKAKKAVDEIVQAQSEHLVQSEVIIVDSCASNMLFGEFMKYWLTVIQGSIQPRTYNDYRLKINNKIAPYFNQQGAQLDTLTTFDIQNYYLKLQKTVTANTVKRYHANIRKALEYAKKVKLIRENPAIYVELPKVRKTQISYYNVDELNMILFRAKGHVLEPVIVLAIYYGLRRSEVVGLKWSAIDFKQKIVNVQEKAIQLHGLEFDQSQKLSFSKEMKTESSLRSIPLIQEVERYLLEWREQIERNRAFFGSEYNQDFEDYICVKPSGNIISPDYITKAFMTFTSRLPMKDKHVTFHGLRHSCATMLLSLGFSIKEIQMWLGHGSYKTTADFYAHLDLYGKSILGDRLNTALNRNGVSAWR